jgi:LmbE family N-acetylglucosaminyl deacetylase
MVLLGRVFEETESMRNHQGTLQALVLIALGVAVGWTCRSTVDNGHRAEAADAVQTAPAVPPSDGKLRIIAFGAHPDDCEIKVGGTAAKWAALGHHVKLVSVTNGDIGHFASAGGPLAKRRLDEVQRADKLLGAHTQVLDIHDGELMPTLENRRWITRLIREWQADIVLAHRPNDYHPDHRYTGVLVQDASFMVTVPFICPDVPPLKKNPLFLYYSDRFERPNPFRADIMVAIDDAIDKKLAALDLMESQFFERGTEGSAEQVVKDRANREERRRQVRQGFMARDAAVAQKYRDKLAEFYGKDAAAKVGHAEAFEITEYGLQPKPEDLKRLFPFYEK